MKLLGCRRNFPSQSLPVGEPQTHFTESYTDFTERPARCAVFRNISVFLGNRANMWISMGEILDLKTIHDYNKFLGLETLNPLVSFVDFSKVEILPHRC